MSLFHKTVAAVQARSRTLYPAIEPFKQGTLAVDARHTLHWEQCGNPAGKHVVMVHGGPGAGCSPTMRRFHDPAKYCITLFDQRGSGRSTPHADCVDNTTWHLVADMEKLRAHLGIAKWQVFGGSWGSTLALAYAETHPAAVSELVLRGIFLLRQFELRFLYQEGASRVFAEAWEPYRDCIPEAERGDFVAAYHRRLFGDDEAAKLSAARAWSVWEGACAYAVPEDPTARYADATFALAFARIENHYFTNKGFFDQEDWLLTNAHRIVEAKIPVTIIQGRYDMVCPFQNAHDLHKALPGSELCAAPLSGHSMNDPDILTHLVVAADKYADRV